MGNAAARIAATLLREDKSHALQLHQLVLTSFTDLVKYDDE